MQLNLEFNPPWCAYVHCDNDLQILFSAPVEYAAFVMVCQRKGRVRCRYLYYAHWRFFSHGTWLFIGTLAFSIPFLSNPFFSIPECRELPADLQPSAVPLICSSVRVSPWHLHVSQHDVTRGLHAPHPVTSSVLMLRKLGTNTSRTGVQQQDTRK